MNKLFISSLLLMSFLFSSAQDVTLEWVNGHGSEDTNSGLSVALDNDDDLIIVGFFNGIVDFEPGSGITNLESSGESDIFIQKLDPDGNLIWVKSIGGNYDDYAISATSDAEGNIYVFGTFYNEVDFDPGAGTSLLTSIGTQDLFVLKLNSNGGFIWVKQIGGGSVWMNAGKMVLDSDENIYLTGRFKLTVDFDPGSGENNLTSEGEYDIYVLKLDNDGDFLWARQIGGDSYDLAVSIDSDDDNSIYITGGFQETVDFDPSSGESILTSAGDYDIFVLKLESDGDFLWVKQIGGVNEDFGNNIHFDNTNVYVTGRFDGIIDFDPSDEDAILTSDGLYPDSFIQKWDENGNMLSVSQFNGRIRLKSMTTDFYGSLYITGGFTGSLDFDPGSGTYYLINEWSRHDIYLLKLDSNFGFNWALHMEYTGNMEIFQNSDGYSLVMDSNENIYLTGSFAKSVDFDPNSGVTNLTSTASNDIFIQKLSQNIVNVEENQSELTYDLIVHPNPSGGQFNIDFNGTSNANLRVYNLSGQKVYSSENLSGSKHIIQLNEPKGMYILELISNGERHYYKLMNE